MKSPELKDRLEESEKLIQEMTVTWEEKLRKTEEIAQVRVSWLMKRVKPHGSLHSGTHGLPSSFLIFSLVDGKSNTIIRNLDLRESILCKINSKDKQDIIAFNHLCEK